MILLFGLVVGLVFFGYSGLLPLTLSGKGPFICTFKILLDIMREVHMPLYFCTVNVNSRVMICTSISAHWQKVSKLNTALWRFELI